MILKKIKLLFVMIIRNIRWLFTLLNSKTNKNQKFNVLNFEMLLDPQSAGIDLKEKSIHKQLALGGIREESATEIMKKFTEPDDIIFELGANIGYYVLIEAKKLTKKGYIYAVEPGPDNFKLLESNVKLNNVKNIELSNIAISDKNGESELFLSKATNCHSLFKKQGSSNYKTIKVKTRTVDSFLKGKKKITFLRMDIEGYETEIIKGMSKTLQEPNFKKLFVEIHPHIVSGKKMQNFLKTLEDNKFNLLYATTHDNFQRKFLGQTTVETNLTLKQLMKDKRIVNKECAFELFLKR